LNQRSKRDVCLSDIVSQGHYSLQTSAVEKPVECQTAKVPCLISWFCAKHVPMFHWKLSGEGNYWGCRHLTLEYSLRLSVSYKPLSAGPFRPLGTLFRVTQADQKKHISYWPFRPWFKKNKPMLKRDLYEIPTVRAPDRSIPTQGLKTLPWAIPSGTWWWWRRSLEWVQPELKNCRKAQNRHVDTHEVIRRSLLKGTFLDIRSCPWEGNIIP